MHENQNNGALKWRTRSASRRRPRDCHAPRPTPQCKLNSLIDSYNISVSDAIFWWLSSYSVATSRREHYRFVRFNAASYCQWYSLGYIICRIQMIIINCAVDLLWNVFSILKVFFKIKIVKMLFKHSWHDQKSIMLFTSCNFSK